MDKQEKKLEAQKNAEAEEKATREAERTYEEILRQAAESLKVSDRRESNTPRRSDINAKIRSRPGGNIWWHFSMVNRECDFIDAASTDLKHFSGHPLRPIV